MPPAAQHVRSNNTVWYLIASVLGVVAGLIDLKLGDLLITAMFVLSSTMLLGALRPARPWRWVLLVAIFVPLLQLLAYTFARQKPYPAQVYESFLGFLTGIAGAYGASYGRRAINEIFK
jgi:hypothetical protein